MRATYLENSSRIMSSEENPQLAADGFTIGAHSKSHPVLGNSPQRR